MFFTQFNQLMTGSVDVTMVIRKSTTGMTVSVLPKSNGLKDEAQNHIVPLTLSGTPEELDNGFFQTIARPVQKVSGGQGYESERNQGGERETGKI